MPRPTVSPSGAQTAFEPETSPRRYSTSTVTRLLCVGAQVDPDFCNAVIRELVETDDLVDGQQRVVAPSYGYDVLPVLGHALHARARRRYRFWTSAMTFVIPVVLLFTAGLTITFVGFLVWFWILWAVNFLDQLALLRILTDRLRAPDEQTGEGFDGRIPYHQRLFEENTFQRIALEQDPTSEVVYYGGYQPFVGAGHLERTAAFPILLNGALDGHPFVGDTRERKAVKPFTSAEMMDHIGTRLRQVLRTEPQIGIGVEGLEISRRYYRTAVGRVRPAPASTIDPATVKDEGYAAAREYLCVRVGSWDEELVASVFITFDVRGNTLYTEVHSYVLHPINGAYRQADRLPESISQQDLWKIALHALGRAARSVVIGLEAVLRVFAVVAKLFARLFGGRAAALPGLELPVTRRQTSDFGARFSIRELAAISGHHHFFQSVDADKYLEIVQRRLFEILVDYLTDMDVDTSEMRARQAAILNFGIVQTGGIINADTVAAGNEVTVATSGRAQEGS